jgi:hypothetical protein
LDSEFPRLGAGLRRVEADHPSPVGAGGGRMGLPGGTHGHQRARSGPSPNGIRGPALQNHMVGEDGRQTKLSGGRGRDEQPGKDRLVVPSVGSPFKVPLKLRRATGLA